MKWPDLEAGRAFSARSLAAVRLRMGRRAPELDAFRLSGAAALSGSVGFTISLFIVDLALDDPGLADQARLGVLAGSATAGVTGALLLRLGSRTRRSSSPIETAPAAPERGVTSS